jgi:hypothetical protein
MEVIVENKTLMKLVGRLHVNNKPTSIFYTLAPSKFEKKIIDLKKGDVIVFQRKEQLIVHRYIAPNKSQGDACLRADEPINATNYLGKITAFQRKNKEMKAIDRLAFWKFTALKLGKLSHFIQWMLLRIRLKFIRN